jgi:hypothetical protein
MKDNLLFDVPKMESPRLKWIKRHRITINNIAEKPDEECPETGEIIPQWVCYQGTNAYWRDGMLNRRTGCGNTEDEAIADWAIKNRKRLWNEEQL